MNSISQYLFLTIFTVILSGCGGGGSGAGGDIVLEDMLGGWTGSVNLSSNSCPRDIPEESQTIYFTHDVTAVLTAPGEATITLDDSGQTCVAERVKTDENSFFAVCPEKVLPGFIDGYECREELVWHYTVYDGDGTAEINPITRTSSVRCYQNGEISFVCPVEYVGKFGRCVRGLC